MTGSGTIGDPYIIYDVDDLQAMKNDLTAYYELNSDINAIDTELWNGGKGFEPIGCGIGSIGELYLVPDSDVSVSGSWTVFPDPPSTLYDKLVDGATFMDTPTPDDAATYIHTTTVGKAVFGFDTSVVEVPTYSTISYIKGCFVRDMGSATHTTNRCWPGLLVNGTWYRSATNYFKPLASWATQDPNEMWTLNPDTLLAWTWEDILGTGSNPLQGFGIEITVIAVDWFRFSTLYFEVHYTAAAFTGHLDGKGYTISNLFINRPDRGCVGLIGYLGSGATISDVTLSNVDMTGYDGVGALVGGISVGASGDPILSNCHSSGSIVSTCRAGGLVGADGNCDGATGGGSGGGGG